MTTFEGVCITKGWERPIPEYKFALPREWRFDWAFPSSMVAVEQEGGIFGRGKKCPTCGRRRVGAHSSIKDMLKDIEKYNTAAILGWRVLRCTPEQFANGSIIVLLEQVLK